MPPSAPRPTAAPRTAARTPERPPSPPQRQQKQRQLLGRLQDLLLGPKADEQTTCEVLDYFLRRLGSPQVASRVLAMKVRHGEGPLCSAPAPRRPRPASHSPRLLLSRFHVERVAVVRSGEADPVSRWPVIPPRAPT